MNEAFSRWIEQNGTLPGVLACGIRFPDGNAACHISSGDLTTAQLKQTLEQLADAVKGLNLHRLVATRLQWSYENGRVYYVLRRDGIGLGAVTAPPVTPDDLAVVEQFLENFLRLTTPA
jgi:hypothetical protein